MAFFSPSPAEIHRNYEVRIPVKTWLYSTWAVLYSSWPDLYSSWAVLYSSWPVLHRRAMRHDNKSIDKSMILMLVMM